MRAVKHGRFLEREPIPRLQVLSKWEVTVRPAQPNSSRIKFAKLRRHRED